MEAIQKLISETKRLAMEEDDLKTELMHLKSELFVEEQSLENLKIKQELLARESTDYQRDLDYSSRHIELIKSFRHNFRSSYKLHAILKGFIDNADPTSEFQERKLQELQGNYNKMLEKYEEIPMYVSIVQEEANEKELANLITQKRNELMKLETQREYA